MGKYLEGINPQSIVFPDPPAKDYKFKCDVDNCGKQFVKLSRLRMHQNTHLNEKPFKCSFEGCSSEYSQTSHLKRHVATRHSKAGGDFKCTFVGCGASFETWSSLHFHEKRKHSVRKYKCSFCEEMFSKKFLLKAHEATHTGKDAFVCKRKECQKTFSSHSTFKVHQKAHREESSGDKTHKCDMCDTVFEKWSAYLEHKKTHPIPLKVECPVCHKMFSKCRLRIHQRLHDDNSFKEAFSCPHEGCPRFYYHMRNLTHHIRYAHEGHSFECKICSRTLSSRQKLELHIKTIHENPPPAKPPVPKAINRKDILIKLCGDSSFECKRRGPPKGFKPKRKLISRSRPAETISTYIVSDDDEIPW